MTNKFSFHIPRVAYVNEKFAYELNDSMYIF